MKAGDNFYLKVFAITLWEQAHLKEKLDNFKIYSKRSGTKCNITIAKSFNL